MSDAGGMDYADFVETATELVNGIMSRVPAEWRDGLAGEISAGIQEPRIFMRNLIPLFTDDQIPITAGERDVVVRLMRHRRMDLAPVERFNVVDEPTA